MLESVVTAGVVILFCVVVVIYSMWLDRNTQKEIRKLRRRIQHLESDDYDPKTRCPDGRI